MYKYLKQKEKKEMSGHEKGKNAHLKAQLPSDPLSRILFASLASPPIPHAAARSCRRLWVRLPP